MSPTLNKVSGHSGDINPYTTPATPEVAKKIRIGHLNRFISVIDFNFYI